MTGPLVTISTKDMICNLMQQYNMVLTCIVASLFCGVVVLCCVYSHKMTHHVYFNVLKWLLLQARRHITIS